MRAVITGLRELSSLLEPQIVALFHGTETSQKSNSFVDDFNITL